MSAKMRQVSKEEFEILTRFHPGEVRYYVDVDKALTTRNRGAKINVKREPVKKKAKRKDENRAKPTAASHVINGTGRGFNKPLLYTGKDAGFLKIGTISKKVELEVKRLFDGIPTRVTGRSDLVNILIRNTGLKRSNVDPVVSQMIKVGALRVKEATS